MKTPVEQAPAPLVSDEQIIGGRLEVGKLNPDYKLYKKPNHFRAPVFRTAPPMSPTEVRDIYETALTKMRAERDDLVGELRSQIQVYKDRMGEPTHEANCVCGYHRIEALLSKYKTE